MPAAPASTRGRGPPPHPSQTSPDGTAFPPDAALEALAAADLVHLNTAGDQVEIAYPLSAAPSPHRVDIHNGPSLAAMCAIDALGVPLMAGTAATIVSHAPDTGQQIRVSRRRDGHRHWEPAATVVVLATATCTGRIAYACRHTAFHAAHEQAHRHLRDSALQQGQILTQQQALAIAETEFGLLLTEDSR
ncbi:organomercurial lyase [Streptomyces sennicomposti]|uniref:organomercurial lyase n=1 Tax=Streptomyces sennicomposti TaxID=2873384 RepID=UPI001CA7906E|nr:organomercurial lyase [Streptomyces sennicomposti]MBY8864500.1 alkylmercury lyase family protein [Streptomyces sennicomposti]